MFTQKRPVFTQKRPVFTQKRPVFTQKRPHITQCGTREYSSVPYGAAACCGVMCLHKRECVYTQEPYTYAKDPILLSVTRASTRAFRLAPLKHVTEHTRTWFSPHVCKYGSFLWKCRFLLWKYRSSLVCEYSSFLWKIRARTRALHLAPLPTALNIITYK